MTPTTLLCYEVTKVRPAVSPDRHQRDPGGVAYQLRGPAVQVADLHLHGVTDFGRVVQIQNETHVLSVKTVHRKQAVPPPNLCRPTFFNPIATDCRMVASGYSAGLRAFRPACKGS